VLHPRDVAPQHHIKVAEFTTNGVSRTQSVMRRWPVASRGNEHLRRLQSVRRAVANAEVGLELRHGETLPLFGLVQEGPFLQRAKRRGLTIERSDCAISAYVFQDSFPAHQIPRLQLVAASMPGTIFKIVSDLTRTGEWFPSY
jgi:hypothetical protein